MRLINSRLKNFVILLSLLCLCLSFFIPSVILYASSAEGKNVYALFNSLIDSIRTCAADKQLLMLQAFIENEDHADFEQAYETLLEWYTFSGQTSKAKEYFQRLSAKNCYRCNSNWMLARIHIREENVSSALKNFSEAIQTGPLSCGFIKDFVEFDHQQVEVINGLELIDKYSEDSELVKIALAFYQYYRVDYEQAIEIFQKISPKISHDPVILYSWGYCHFRISQYNKADSLWRIGLKLSREKQDLKNSAKFLSNIGLLLRQVHFDNDAALAYYDSAYAIAKQINDYHRIQILAGYMGYLNRFRGDYAIAEKQFEEAIQIASKIGKPRFLADWYKGYAFTLYYLGRYSEALRAMGKSKEYVIKSNNQELLVVTMLDEASIYISIKQHHLARQTINEAFKLAEQYNLLYYQKLARGNLGQIHLLENEYLQARTLFNEFIEYLTNNEDLRKRAYIWLERVGKTYQLENRYALAKKSYLEALQIAKEAGIKNFQGWSLLGIGDIEVLEGNIDVAMLNYHLAKEIALEQNNPEMLWEIHLGFGNAYMKAGNLDSAITAYRNAANILEKIRNKLNVDRLRIGYFIEGYEVYKNLVQCYVRRYEQTGNSHDLDSLFYYHEMSRGRGLQDLIRGKRSLAQDDKYDRTVSEFCGLQRRKRIIEAGQFCTENDWNDIQSQLETLSLSLLAQQLRFTEVEQVSDVKKQIEIPSLTTITKNLKNAELGLLLYHISADISFALIVANGEVRIVRLPIHPISLGSMIDSLMTPLTRVSAESVQNTLFRAHVAYQLYRSLIVPIEEIVNLPEQLLIVPDFNLRNLPFEILLINQPDSLEYTPNEFPDYADHFLLNRYSVVYSPNASLMHEKSETTTCRPKILVFANPLSFDSTSYTNHVNFRNGRRFGPLPNTEIEAQKIQDILSSTTVYKRWQATEAVFRENAPKYDIIHIASHAFADLNCDAFSGLVLSVSNNLNDDGLLMGYEILNLNLSCDLVTLNACETGRGNIVAGEGVLGLPRLFLGAGAKTVLMTLWNVDDKFACTLISEFYKLFLKERLSKTESLNKAKRLILSDKNAKNKIYYQHPLYWASYVLYGDPGTGYSYFACKAKLFILIAAAFLILTFIGYIPRYLTQKRMV